MSAMLPVRRVTTAVLLLAGTAALVAAPGGQTPAQAGRGQGAGPAARAAASGDIRVLKVRPNIYMLTGAGGNITVMTFPEGTLVVDTGTTQMASAVLDTIKRLSDKPIAHIINTSATADHIGGNETLAASGRRIPLEVVAGEGPMIVAHENVM